jgi:hypothetical protein
MDIDRRIQLWWAAVKKGPESYFTQKWDAELLALGPAALERTLDCIEGKAKLDIPRQGYLEIRDLGNWEDIAVVAFARADVGGVLRAVKGRRWDDLRIALYLGSVPAPEILPYVLTLAANKEPETRRTAINDLALHRDPRATDALIAALRDRSSSVRFSAIERLGDLGDPRAIEPLRSFAIESQASVRHAYLGESAKAAIKKIQANVRKEAASEAFRKPLKRPPKRRRE